MYSQVGVELVQTPDSFASFVDKTSSAIRYDYRHTLIPVTS